MVEYKGDLHVHTVISPCGDLEMSPTNIVAKAKEVGLNIIGIADHNCTKHAPLIRKLAHKEGIFVLMGAEVTSREEAHCLAFFPAALLLRFLDLLSLLLRFHRHRHHFRTLKMCLILRLLIVLLLLLGY